MINSMIQNIGDSRPRVDLDEIIARGEAFSRQVEEERIKKELEEKLLASKEPEITASKEVKEPTQTGLHLFVIGEFGSERVNQYENLQFMRYFNQGSEKIDGMIKRYRKLAKKSFLRRLFTSRAIIRRLLEKYLEILEDY